MRKCLFLFACLACLPIASRGQGLEDAELSELLQPKQAHALRYWFDEDAHTIHIVSTLTGEYAPDVSALDDGLHVLHYMVVGTSGEVYSTSSEIFIKMEEVLSDVNANRKVTAKGITYWFDDDSSHKYTTNSLSGTYVLDVSALADGLHVIHYLVVDEESIPYGLTSTMFLKDEAQYAVHEPTLITKYVYWLNNDNSTAQEISLTLPSNPSALITLLPLQHMPIRSSAFHFQMDEGVPTIYAKNTFNIRFYDSRGYFVDNFMEGERMFIDYSVSQQITETELLESGIISTTAKPAENAIKWYHLFAEPGDSLEFKLDRAATIQLFSPSGRELYNVSGAESTKWRGCHVSEKGCYYLALHDVTSTTGSNISLDYNHIDKFALLSYSPNEIGIVNNIMNISLNGNGFNHLKGASLKMGQTELKPETINVESKDKAIFQFILSGSESIGLYDIVLDFDDGEEQKTLTKESAVSLVNAEWGEVKTTISHTTTWQMPLTVSIKVRNTGNVPYHLVPINIAYDSPQTVSKVEFDNFYIPQSQQAIEEGYTPIFKTDKFMGEAVPAIVSNLFIPELGANEEKEFVLKMNSGGGRNFNVYAWTGEPINSQERMTESAEQRGASEARDAQTNIPSYEAYLDELLELYKDQATLAHDLKDIDEINNLPTWQKCIKITQLAYDAAKISYSTGQVIGGIVLGMESKLDEMQLNVIDDYEVSEFLRNRIRNRRLPSPSSIFDNTNIPFIGKFLKIWEFQNGLFERKEPKVNAHNVAIPSAFDPNEITGYLSVAGSPYMPKGLLQTSYTIECENDLEHATSAAHRVVISDRLDGTTHDLSSFAATGVKIGNKYMALDGEKQFVKTMDLRPELNVIAEVRLTYDETIGDAQWIINSLDPMTMELAEDPAQGALPLNVDGNGIAEVYFSIGLKGDLSDGDEVTNQASIVFDEEAPILTPVWKNTMDGILPTSHITNIESNADNSISVCVSASDNRSQPWQYDVYAKLSESDEWDRVAVGIPVDQKATIGFNVAGSYDFYSVVTDFAGNIEEKEPTNEFSLNVHAKILAGDVNNDGKITAQDASLILQHVAGKKTISGDAAIAAEINGDTNITAQDASLILQHVSGKKKL